MNFEDGIEHHRPSFKDEDGVCVGQRFIARIIGDELRRIESGQCHNNINHHKEGLKEM